VKLLFKRDFFTSLLEKEAALEESREERVKGYKVKVIQPLGEHEKRTRREAIAKVILQAMRRLKQRSKN